MSSPGDIAQVSVVYNTPAGIAQNNFGFVNILADAGGLASLASKFTTAMVKNTSGGLLYEQVDDNFVTEVDVEDVKPGTAATYVYTFSAVSGRLAGDPVPAQIAAVLSLRTDLKGRSYRGRVYLPGISELDVDMKSFNAGAITAFSTIATQLLAVFGPAGSDTQWRLAVISRWNNKVKRATPVATQVTSIAVDTIPFSQRRRVFGVGS